MLQVSNSHKEGGGALNAGMTYGLGSSSVSSNQKQLPLLQDFLSPHTWAGAETSAPPRNVAGASGEAGTAVLACSQDAALSRSISIEDERLAFLNGVSTTGVARLATGDQISGNVVESVAVEVVNHQIVAASLLPDFPSDGPLAPVARVTSRTDRIVEHLPVFQDSSRLRGQWVALPTKEAAISSLRYSLT